MTAAIDRLFTADILDAIERRFSMLDARAREAFETLTAHGPAPSLDHPDKAWRLKCRRAQRAAWEAYLDAAEACGLLDDEMAGNLRSFEPAQFRGALGEAMTCWLLAGKLGYSVAPRPAGQKLSRLEMRVTAHGTEFDVEVKAPYLDERNAHRSADVLVETLRSAARQLKKGRCNVLAIAPQFPMPVHTNRHAMLKAFIGQHERVIPIALSDDVEVPKPFDRFNPNGHLARRQRFPDGTLADPRFTRVSAIVTIEETPYERTPEYFDLNADQEIRHKVLVLHNPTPAVPLDERMFADWPQFIRRDDEMFWNDRQQGKP